MSAEPSSKKPKSDDTDTQFLDLTLPFPAAKYRDLAFEVLIADKDPKNSRVKRTIAVSGEKELAVKFESKDLKSIGVGGYQEVSRNFFGVLDLRGSFGHTAYLVYPYKSRSGRAKSVQF